jgi:hypothetical protein
MALDDTGTHYQIVGALVVRRIPDQLAARRRDRVPHRG